MKMKIKNLLLYICILLIPALSFTDVNILDSNVSLVIKGICTLVIIIASIINLLVSKNKYKNLTFGYVAILFMVILLLIFGKREVFLSNVVDKLLLFSYPLFLINVILNIKGTNKKKILDLLLINNIVYLALTFLYYCFKFDITKCLLIFHNNMLVTIPILCIYFYRNPKWYYFILLSLIVVISCILSTHDVLVIINLLLIIQLFYDKLKDKTVFLKKIIYIVFGIAISIGGTFLIDNKINPLDLYNINSNTLINLIFLIPLMSVLIIKRRKFKSFIKNGYETLVFYIIIILSIIILLTNIGISLIEIITIGLILAISIDYIEKPFISKKVANKISIIALDKMNEELIDLIDYFKKEQYSVIIYTNKEKNIDVDQVIDKKKKLINMLNKVEEGFVIACDKSSFKLLEKIKNDYVIKLYRSEKEKLKKYNQIDYLISKYYVEGENAYYIPEVISKKITIESPLTSKSILAYCRNYNQFLQLVDIYKLIDTDWKLTCLINSQKNKINSYLDKQENSMDITIIEKLDDRLADYSMFIILENDKYINGCLPLILLNGLPCICYEDTFGGLIRDEENAYIIVKNNQKQMIDKINLLINNIDKRKVFGKNAIRIAGEYSKEEVYPMWLEMFEKIEDNIIKEKNNKRR